MKIQIYRNQGFWHGRVVASNGRILTNTSAHEEYKTSLQVVKNLKAVGRLAPKWERYAKIWKGKNGRWFGHLEAYKNRQILIVASQGHGYRRSRGVRNALQKTVVLCDTSYVCK